jgi:hypothetical protein
MRRAAVRLHIQPFGRDRMLGYRWPADIALPDLFPPPVRSDGHAKRLLDLPIQNHS